MAASTTDNGCLNDSKRQNLQDDKIEEILSAINELTIQVQELCRPKIFNNKQVMEILGIGPKLLQNYRNYGLLSYSRSGDKYWYTEDDIKEFLKKNHKEAFAYY